jgi:hypothetical protein
VPSREIQIPLFLWIAVAIIVHLLWGGGTQEVAVVVEEKAALRGFAARIQHEVQAELRPIQITMLDSDKIEPPKPAEPEEAIEPDEDQEKKRLAEKAIKKAKKADLEAEKKKEPEKSEPKPPEKPEVKPEEKKDIDLLAKKSESKPVQELRIERQKRISVRQHVEDQNQKDNPDAKFLGEKANRVKEETQAKITSTDQDHPNPTPGSSPNQAPSKEPGNADQSRVASAFGEADEGSSLPPPPPPEADSKPKPLPNQPQAQQEPEKAQEPNRPKQSDRHPADRVGQQMQSEDPGARTSPNIVAGEQGSFSVGGPAQPRPKKKRLPPVKANQPSDLFGLGSGTVTASGIHLNLSHSDAVAVVGQEQLQTDRRMDQLRRRAKRAGSWKTVGIERYRSAIENYVPSVRPGNTTALNTAASPFATYLNDIHNRIHPIFADDFLGSLNRLPASDPMNRSDLRTEVEIVVSKLDGSLVRRGLTRSSGILQFDVSALASIDRAAPFGPPPDAIVSPDGNVYLHWEFYRNPDYACSTYFAHPFLLKAAPKPTTPEQAPTEPGPRQLPGPRIMPTFERVPANRNPQSIQL